MDIKKIIKEHHQDMIDKGFYDCPECEKDHPGQTLRYGEYMDCPNCDGSNVDPNKNIGELLMLIASELGEALEAHRNNRFANWEKYDNLFHFVSKSSIDNFDLKNGSLLMYKNEVQYLFTSHIKDTFEDEIADVFLRLFALCGYLIPEENYENIQAFYDKKCSSYPDGIENIGQWLFSISMQLGEISHMHYKNIIPLGAIAIVLSNLKKACEILNIPIEKHIEAKMAYNKTRPHKHGKEY